MLEHRLTNELSALVRVLGGALQPLSRSLTVLARRMLGEMVHENRTLLHGSHRIPQCILDRFVELGHQALRRVRMAGVAAEAALLAFLQFEQHAMAFWTCELR